MSDEKYEEILDAMNATHPRPLVTAELAPGLYKYVFESALAAQVDAQKAFYLAFLPVTACFDVLTASLCDFMAAWQAKHPQKLDLLPRARYRAALKHLPNTLRELHP